MTLLQLLLRLFGTSSLLALIFVAAPHAWMQDIHAGLGMGDLPDAPVVWYLARSTSAFYAILGGLFWVVSFDTARYRSVLSYMGSAIVFLGVALLGVDYLEGMPWFWRVWEGPVVVFFGLAMLVLTRRQPEGAS
jgi:hypothetical protein